jgi:acyl carrier protein
VAGVGLDTVELVFAIEAEFGVVIPDEKAAKLNTVGDMHAFLVSELARCVPTAVDDELIYVKLREVICHHTGVKPEEVVPSARFVQDLRLD